MGAAWSGAALSSALLLISGCGDQPPAPAGPVALADRHPPQVVLVTLDTLSADRLGCYGGRDVATPHLDSIAADGVRFARAAVPMPQTAPSHASLLTGRSPFSHGLTDNWHSLAPEVDTLAELLLRRGVETGCFYNVFQFNDANLVQGFRTQVRDVSDLANDLLPKFFGWLDALPPAKPSFAWIHLFIAHTPFVPPDAHRARYVTADYDGPLDFSVRTRLELLRSGGFPPHYADEFLQLYDAEVAFLDERVGALLDGLRARDRLDRTLLLFMADHGESRALPTLGMHAFVASQETLRVPLLVRGPGVARGAVVESLVENVDLLPTVLESFGHDPVALLGELLDGRSLWPLLAADASEASDDAAGGAAGTLDADERVAFGALPCTPPPPGELPDVERLCAWQGRFKLVVQQRDGGEQEQLFDVDADPHEQHDVAAAHPNVVRALRRRLDDWLARTAARRAPAGPLSRAGQQMLQQLGYGDR